MIGKSLRASSRRRIAVKLLQIELLNHVVLRGAASKYPDEDVTRALKAEQVARNSAEAASPCHLIRLHRTSLTLAAIAKPEPDWFSGGIKRAVGFVTRRNKKGYDRASDQAVQGDAQHQTTVIPNQSQRVYSFALRVLIIQRVPGGPPISLSSGAGLGWWTGAVPVNFMTGLRPNTRSD